MKSTKKAVVIREPMFHRVAEWLIKRTGEIIPAQKIGFKILEVSGNDVIKIGCFSRWVSECRFYLEHKYGYTIYYSRRTGGYEVVKKGSKQASKFTMKHYRRAVINAARAQELDDLGFLNKDHIPELIEQVFDKAHSRTGELAGMKKVLLEKWQLVDKQERKELTDGTKKKD